MENKIVYSNTNSARDRDTKDYQKKNLSGISVRSDNKEETYPSLGNNFNNFTSNFNNLNLNSYGANHQDDNLYKLYKNNLLNNSPSTYKKENPVVKKSEHDSNIMEMMASMK